MIEQVVINILKNANESFPDIGADKLIEVELTKIDDKILLKIKDNGKSISDDILEDIFVPFFSTKEKGSGIGLSLSR